MGPTLLIADDHAIVAAGLQKLLEQSFDVVGVVHDGRELIKQAEAIKPALIVLDISMPLLNGVDAMNHLRKILPSTHIVVVTQHTGRAYVEAAFDAGARGYVLKQSAPLELVTALNDVSIGKFYLTPALVPPGIACPGETPEISNVPFRNHLTHRQREVLQLVAEGKSGKQIAIILNVSLKTVEFHKARLMKQLDLFTTAELTRYAIEHGMVHLGSGGPPSTQ